MNAATLYPVVCIGEQGQNAAEVSFLTSQRFSAFHE